MRKRIASCLVICMTGLVILSTGCTTSSDTNKSSATTEITVWSFTDEAKYAIQKFEEKYPDIKVNLVYIAGAQYQNKLMSALQTGAQAPDVFALENSYVRKFIDNPALTDLGQYKAQDLLSQQYPYIQATEKDTSGKVKAIGYQGTPGGFYYRRDLAKTYLGTDDPDKVSEAISTWDKAIQLGQKVVQESNGKVHAFANWNDIATVTNGSVKSPWLQDGKLVIDQTRLDGIEIAKKAYDTNVTAQLEPLSPGDYASMQNGTVMFYPGATWFLQYTLKTNAPKTSGQWGLAHGPGAFYAGGTYYSIYNKSKKQDAAWKFINFYSFDHDFLTELGKDQTYFTSNKEVNTSLTDVVKDDFLGGQKYFEFFNIEADKVPSVTRSKYDGNIDSIFSTDAQLYMTGTIKTQAELITRFKQDVKHDFPELNVD